MASRSLRTGVGAGFARPTFSRANSGSSCASAKSEDSLTGTLRSLALESPGRTGSPAGISSKTKPSDDRRPSAPIAIELPKSTTHAYTPLTARGDLPGGYFPQHNPNHNDPRRPSGLTITDLTVAQRNHQPLDTPPIMSAASSAAGTPLSPPLLPAALLVPMGKYHPSNYQSPVQTNAPNSRPSTSSSTPLPNMNLSAPKVRRGASRPNRPEHKRQTSEVRQKLEKYQKDMIRQAKTAASKSRRKIREPNSPRLTPTPGLGSPGIITPLELENEGVDFLSAGERRRKTTSGSAFGTRSVEATRDDRLSPVAML